MKLPAAIPLIGLLLSGAFVLSILRHDFPSSAGALERQAVSLETMIETTSLPIHAVLVAHGGEIVFEHYRAGGDETRRGLHDMRSISKSVTSLMIGIAVDRDQIDLDTSIFAYLPEYADLASPEKSRITVRNLLAMDSGLVANEMVAWNDPGNTERLMIESDDPVRFALTRQAIHPPGSRWAYDGVSTMVLARILQNASGRELFDFARQELFGPLGIRDVEWTRLEKSGRYAAHGGLRLKPRDLLKIGDLLLLDGHWNGRTIVSPAWLALSTAPVHDAWYSERYGLHWWSGTSGLPDGRTVAWTEALGIGGQRLYVVPELGLIVVITAGLYERADQGSVVRAVFEKAIAEYGVH